MHQPRIRIHRSVLAVVVLALVTWSPDTRAAAEEDAGAPPRQKPVRETLLRTHLKQTVDALTAPELAGRGAWAQRRLAADWIALQFKAVGLKPLPGRTGYFDDHGGTEEQPEARNVVGWLPAPARQPDEQEPAPYILVSAHYDHLGKKDGKIHPGADDNASGVAVMLEVARAMAKVKLRRAVGVVFVAFDLEEQHLVGSRRYCEKPPLALDGLRAFVTFDMMGRSVGDLAPGALFLMGAEHSPDMEKLVDTLGSPEGGQRIRLGIDFQPGYSDYVHFAERKVPYLFVTSGACADYHRPGDTRDKIDWAHLELRTKWSLQLCEALARRAATPLTWAPRTEPRVEEIQDLVAALTAFEPRLDQVEGLPPGARNLFKAYTRMLKKSLEDGVISEGERKYARTQALMLFQFARSMPR